MIDPRKFKAPVHPKEQIWREVEKLRAASPAPRSLPVPVFDLAQFDLGLDLVPVEGLSEQLDIDALLIGDLRSILLDKRTFMSPRLEYRLRFSVAHEIAHLILHRHVYASLEHTTPREWLDYMSAIPTIEYGRVEWQACEFAGRLTVPREPLRDAFEATVKSAQPASPSDWLAEDEAALDYIAACIAPQFGVAPEVIAKRIRVEKLSPLPSQT
jgi:hypothetical protein